MSVCVTWCVLLNILVLVATSPTNLTIVSRDEWHAKPPKSIEAMTNPVPFVVIHHSYQPAACYTTEDCIEAMHWMQDLHQIKNGWVDIGYNFAVGSDGKAYEGRGWSRVGAHSPHYNNVSIGICLIGDWSVNLPPLQQLNVVHELIQMGLAQGKIAEDYKLVGHRQVRIGTECPGDRLYGEIQSWPHFYCEPLPKYLPTTESTEKVALAAGEDNRLKKRTPENS